MDKIKEVSFGLSATPLFGGVAWLLSICTCIIPSPCFSLPVVTYLLDFELLPFFLERNKNIYNQEKNKGNQEKKKDGKDWKWHQGNDKNVDANPTDDV